MTKPIDAIYKRKKPCSDCPFRKDAKYHSGVLKALPEYHGNIEKGVFAHTCHLTDPRSDGFSEKHKGVAHHCMGAIAFCDNLKEPQGHIIKALYHGDIKEKDLHKSKQLVFKSMLQMVRRYARLSGHKDLVRAADA